MANLFQAFGLAAIGGFGAYALRHLRQHHLAKRDEYIRMLQDELQNISQDESGENKSSKIGATTRKLEDWSNLSWLEQALQSPPWNYVISEDEESSSSGSDTTTTSSDNEDEQNAEQSGNQNDDDEDDDDEDDDDEENENQEQNE
jgi:hypothetical protein